MGKGEETRSMILDAALAQASEAGFESLTIGTLASKTGLSKSGLFAHFGSREELQIATLDHAAQRFIATVMTPAMQAERGLPRLHAIFERWLTWTQCNALGFGCPLHAASIEFDDTPGPVRDHIVAHFTRLQSALERALVLAVGAGHLCDDLDTGQTVFEILGIIFSYYHSARLMQQPDATARARRAFTRLLAAAAPAA